MSKLGKFGSDLSRLSEIIKVMNKHGFSPTKNRLSWLDFRSKKSKSEIKKNTQAQQFTAMLEELGPTFIKLGQLLSTRGDLLPPDFITALSKLQDSAPPTDFAEIKKQIESSLENNIDQLFASVDPKPLASASIAQVHLAKLKDGTEVVIKVLKPNIKKQIERDTSMIMMVAQVLEWLIEEASEYQAANLAEEFLSALASEVDFSIEAANLALFADRNKNRPEVKVPKFYSKLSSSHVLTMERIHGIPITRLLSQGNQQVSANVIENLLDVAFEHLFVDGIFHGDPHPGNILITNDHKIAFIDFGLLGHVARDHQDRLLSILLALSLKDPDTLSRQLIHLGVPSVRVPIYQFRNSVRKLLDQYAGLNIGSIRAGNILNDLLDVSMKYKIYLPREFALLAKATLSLEGIVRSLHADIHVGAHLSEKAQKLLIERMDPRNFQAAGAKTALQLATLAQDLPAQINQTLTDLERGEIQVAIHSKDIAKLNKTLRIMIVSIFSGLLSTAFVLSGFYILMQPQTDTRWISYLSFALAGFLFLTTICWTAISESNLPKLSLRKWIRKLKQNQE